MPDIFERLYTVPEAAEVSRLSISWWRMSVFKRRVRFLRVGRRILIPASTIEELCTSSVVEPVNRKL